MQFKASVEGNKHEILLRGTVFTIITIKDTGEVSNLLTYESLNKCGFDRHPKNIPISEGSYY